MMLTTRRGLDELACAFSTTEPATAASRTTLLVMLSSAMRLYVPGARTMRPTAVLAIALVRSATVLTAAVPGGYGGGDGNGGKRGGEGGGECRSRSTTASMSEEGAATYAYEPLRATLFTCEQHVRVSE